MDSFFQSAGELIFFDTIQDYLMHEASYLLGEILGNVYSLLGGILLTLMTIWVLIHGYRIMSGQSRDSLMGFMMTSGKAVAIIALATGVGAGGARLFQGMTTGLTESVTYMVTGDSTSDPYKEIDKNLKLMQGGLGAIKAIDTGDNDAVESERTQALWMSGVGVAGPAVVAGTMLVINKFAWALFIGFAPIFILCLLFDQTKGMFTKWLNFGIGITVSLAVLTFMSEIAMRMIGALALVVFGRDLFGLSDGGFTSAAMQQGGLGLVLTALLITVPNMAANFVGGFTSGFHGSNLLGSGGAGTTAAPGSAAAAGGGTVMQSGGSGNSGNNDGSRGNSGTGSMTHGSRHTIPTESSAGQNYNAPRTESSMGYASQGGSSGGSSAAVGAGAAYGGLSAASGGYSGSTTMSDGGVSGGGAGSTASGGSAGASGGSVGSSAGGSASSGFNPPSRTYAEIATGSSAGSQASALASGASTASSGGASISAAPPSSTASTSSVTPTGSVTANAGVNQMDVNSIRKGSDLPIKRG